VRTQRSTSTSANISRIEVVINVLDYVGHDGLQFGY
jgi:hypothetical protein